MAEAFQVRETTIRQDPEPPKAKGSVSRGWGDKQAAAAVRADGQSRLLGAVGGVGGDTFGFSLREGLPLAWVDGRVGASLPSAGSGMRVAIQDRAVELAATIVSGTKLRIVATDPGDRALWQDVSLRVPQNAVPEALNLAASSKADRRSIAPMLNAARVGLLSAELRCLVGVLVVSAVDAEMMGAGPVTNLAEAADAARTLANSYKRAIDGAGGAGLTVWIAHRRPEEITAEPVKKVSTQGAGHRFPGSLAAGRAAEAAVETSCRAVSWTAVQHVTGLAG